MNTTEKTIRIMIADDHQMFIDGVKTMLRRVKTVAVVAEALDGKQALEIIKTTEIDLLITDINMPEISGIELTKIVKEKYPDIKVLVLTMYNDNEMISEILMAEAEGYILKNTGRQELLKAINRIADNGTYYSEEVMNIMMEGLSRTKKIEKKTKELTPREKEIIELICMEQSSSQIADSLFISPMTVETHRKNIYKKLNVNTVIGLMKFAIENEIIKLK